MAKHKQIIPPLLLVDILAEDVARNDCLEVVTLVLYVNRYVNARALYNNKLIVTLALLPGCARSLG